MTSHVLRGGYRRARVVLAAAVIFGLVVIGPVALAAGGSGDPEATGSASVKKLVKKLKKKVNKLEEQVSGLEEQVSGPAGGDLTGNYPNPAIAANAVNSGKVGPNSLTGADINEATLSLDIQPVFEPSANNSNSPKQVFASCPPGTHVITTGANIEGGLLGSSPNQLSEVVITRVMAITEDDVWVVAHETDSFGGNWRVFAQALCTPFGV